MDDVSVSLERVTKRYGGFTAVDDLSFTVKRGEIFGFLGPNGAGKTTTLRMLLDIIRPTSGALSILGSSSAIPVRRRIGYLPEERGLYRKMRAAESIAYFAELRGLSRRDAKAKALKLLDEFGLSEFARSKNEALSKGMAQKVQLLATIAHDPELLILDEPFSGLDPINQQTLETLIKDLRRDGRTIIFSTHVMQHAERLCDRFLIIAKGQKRFEGALAEARAAFSRKLHVVTSAEIVELEALPSVAGVSRGAEVSQNETDFAVELTATASPQQFLREAVTRDIPITKFEEAGATLHDIFVALAGDEADSSVERTAGERASRLEAAE